jgi:hypothetical protein
MYRLPLGKAAFATVAVNSGTSKIGSGCIDIQIPPARFTGELYNFSTEAFPQQFANNIYPEPTRTMSHTCAAPQIDRDSLP